MFLTECIHFNRPKGIYQNIHAIEEHVDGGNTGSGISTTGTGTGTNSSNAQQSQMSSRLSGSDSKSIIRSDAFGNGSGSSSFNLSGTVASLNLSTSMGLSSSTAATSYGGDGPTPPMPHRRLAKSFSVAPSTSTKGLRLLCSYINTRSFQHRISTLYFSYTTSCTTLFYSIV